MAKLMAYLKFDNSKKAVAYYEEVFGAVNYGLQGVDEKAAQSMGLTGDVSEYTVHGAFGIAGNTILCSDSFGDEVDYGKSINFLLDFNSEDTKEMENLDSMFAKIAGDQNTKVMMKLEEQFWGGKMGMLTDKYGIVWSFHAQPYSKLASEHK